MDAHYTASYNTTGYPTGYYFTRSTTYNNCTVVYSSTCITPTTAATTVSPFGVVGGFVGPNVADLLCTCLGDDCCQVLVSVAVALAVVYITQYAQIPTTDDFQFADR